MKKLIQIFLSFLCTITCTRVAVASPNILWIITDDQRTDQVQYMPQTLATLANRGIKYNFAHVSNTLCCPSRSAMFTGQYNSKNGVKHNRFELNGSTILDDLNPTYFTGLVGKYLNSWKQNKHLPTMDWSAIVPRGIAQYIKQTYYVNGVKKKIEDNTNPNQIVDFALEFLDKSKKQQDPFFLVLAFAAPHYPAKADKQDIGRFANEKIIRPSSYKRVDLNKPRYTHQKLRRKQYVNDTIFLKKQKDTLFSLDRALSRLFPKIDFSNTMVIFISDNGLMHGEHNLYSKGVPYEEATNVPLIIRYDPLISIPKTYENLVAHIDITATTYALAGVTPSRSIDGIDLRPTFSDSNIVVRDQLLLEGWRDKWKADYRSNYYGVLTNNRLKLIHNENDVSELYDLSNDPYEMNNLFNVSNEAQKKEDMNAKLNNLLLQIRGKISFE